jgi:hypothetical protein
MLIRQLTALSVQGEHSTVLFCADCIPVAAHVLPQLQLEAAHETMTRAAPEVGVFCRYTSLYFRVTCRYIVSEWVKLKLEVNDITSRCFFFNEV